MGRGSKLPVDSQRGAPRLGPLREEPTELFHGLAMVSEEKQETNGPLVPSRALNDFSSLVSQAL